MPGFLQKFNKKTSSPLNYSQLEKRLEKIEDEIENIKTNSLAHIQKIGLVRFNPFLETGGNVSFVIALLDGMNSGFVITSLHSRGGTRTYAKPIIKGNSKFELSKDEQRAIIKAIQGK